MESQTSPKETQFHVNHHVIEVFEVDKASLDSMELRIQQKPRLLHTSAGSSSCCIFKVPQTLIEINLKSYQPHIISIGPYHHGRDHLQTIEEHKWRFLGSFISNTKAQGRCLEDYLKEIGSMETKARQSYSGDIELSRTKFVEMLVLDGCFIIEILRIVGGLSDVDEEDPIFTMQWIFSFLMRDLIKLENQIPYFVLQRLYDLSKEEDHPSLTMLALTFFNYAMQRPDEVMERYVDLKPLHLLDLLRLCFIPSEKNVPGQKKRVSEPKMIHCATKLYQAGIKFEVGKADTTILDVRFENGVMKIPTVTIDDFTTSLFLNCIAFEQCHGSQSMHINTYAAFLGSLMNSARDVGMLRDRDIVENYHGTDEEVAKFFNDLGKDVVLAVADCYLSDLFRDVDEYNRNTWNVQWATFRHTYFVTPWSVISLLAALTLLLLTLAQTFFSVYGYFRPPS